MTGLKLIAFIATASASIVSCYSLALQAANERLAVAAARERITHDIAEMRLLRAELRTRSRLPELQRWNEEVLALAPPRAEQLVTGPVMLAGYAAVPAGPTNFAAVVRDAPVPAAVLNRVNYAPRMARDLGTDATLAGAIGAAMPAGFHKVVLR